MVVRRFNWQPERLSWAVCTPVQGTSAACRLVMNHISHASWPVAGDLAYKAEVSGYQQGFLDNAIRIAFDA
jgi:hypothetical protein